MENWVLEAKERANTGKAPLYSGRTSVAGKISFDDLVFIPAQLAKSPVDYFSEKISTETTIGITSKKPLKISTPILFGAISFGAVSKESKIALAKASTLVGTAANTGEGGMLPEERKEARLLTVQYSTGRFGISDNVLKQADMIEIKIGQGAKPGQGGLLPKDKVTAEIAKLRGVPMGHDIHSPARHPDIKNTTDLKNKVEWLRELTGGKPIIIKMGAGNVEADVAFAVKANPDVIAIDGMGGGTAAAPRIMMDSFGIPTLAALVRARKTLDKLRARQQLIIGGGLNKGADMAKALALGADAVFVATPLLIAMGCTWCRQCHTGICPVGITTQKPELRKKFDPQAAQHIANYIGACTEEMKMAAGAVGKSDIHDLDRNDLRSLSETISKITGIPLV